MAKIGYIRVSTVEQNEGRQIESLKTLGVERVFMDKLSGKDINRPELQKMIDYSRTNDIVYVESFSRLARNTKDLLTLVETLQDKGVNVISLKENFDTATPTGKLMLTMMGAINTFERDIMLQRQKEGIALAKKNGKYKGRAKVQRPANWIELVSLYQNRHKTATALAKECEVSRPVIYKWLKEDKEQKRTTA